MVNILVSLSRFSLLFLIAIYVYDCFLSLRSNIGKTEANILHAGQRVIIYAIILNGNLVLTMVNDDYKILIFMAAEFAFMIFTAELYNVLYPNSSVVLLNNMFLLFGVGLLMLERISFDKAIRQFVFAAIAVLVSFLIPLIISMFYKMERFSACFAFVGIVALLAVLIFANTTYGAKLSLTFGDFAIQPSEFVKITYVLFAAGYLYNDSSFKRVVKTSIFAAIHVLILVGSKDLGGALLFLFTYLVILYVASKRPIYMLLGLCFGAVAAVVSYYLFSHVQDRVIAWLDPLSVIDDQGYQIAQSLFAIGAGGWIGTGIGQGSPGKIPVVTNDFIFAAICEELGGIFGICVIFVFVCTMLMIFNISMKIQDNFFKLVALGLGTMFSTQSILSLGGVIKFIPSTGVTLPLMSYGGSSLFATIIMFALIQGLYVRHNMEVEENE